MNQNVKGIVYISVIIVTFFVVTLLSLRTHSENPAPEISDNLLEFSIKENAVDYSNCLESGGDWLKFSNSCADFCESNTSCSFLVIYSCDCPNEGCWSKSESKCKFLTEE